MKTLTNWNEWVPTNEIEKATTKLFAEQSLWVRKDFFVRLAKKGFSAKEWFDRGMHHNEDADGAPLWPWTSFQAESWDTELIEGERYIRARRSWQPSNDAINTADIPRITTIKEILSLVESGLPTAQTLYPRKLAQIVIGNFERVRDRLRNELDHLHHDWRTP